MELVLFLLAGFLSLTEGQSEWNCMIYYLSHCIYAYHFIGCPLSAHLYISLVTMLNPVS